MTAGQLLTKADYQLMQTTAPDGRRMIEQHATKLRGTLQRRPADGRAIKAAMDRLAYVLDEWSGY